MNFLSKLLTKLRHKNLVQKPVTSNELNRDSTKKMSFCYFIHEYPDFFYRVQEMEIKPHEHSVQ